MNDVNPQIDQKTARDSTRFESWKEIAAYLGRDERTVRRWEKQEALPVQRHIHNSGASVYAFKTDLDQWRLNRSKSRQSDSSQDVSKGRIEWLRLIVAGALWCLFYNLLTGAAWALWLRHSGSAVFHPVLAASHPDNTKAASFMVLTLAMGLSAMWLYASISIRFSRRSLNALSTGAVLWWLWGLMPVLPDFVTRTLPATKGTILELISKFAVISLSTFCGAWIYAVQSPFSSTSPERNRALKG